MKTGAARYSELWLSPGYYLCMLPHDWKTILCQPQAIKTSLSWPLIFNISGKIDKSNFRLCFATDSQFDKEES
jgi:hypothetical protein